MSGANAGWPCRPARTSCISRVVGAVLMIGGGVASYLVISQQMGGDESAETGEAEGEPADEPTDEDDEAKTRLPPQGTANRRRWDWLASPVFDSARIKSVPGSQMTCQVVCSDKPPLRYP
jgi:hypothetical protein